MSRKSATDFTKSKTPDNVSGSIKKALDLVKSLRESQGNPTMEQAVGAGNLGSMMAEVAQAFSNPNNQKNEDKKKRRDEILAELERLRQMLQDLLDIEPQTEELIKSENEIRAAISKLEDELEQLEKEIT
jgi:DNA repair exonuclease SbcCD ATPase subunit